jgi:hypothetical protein
MRGAAGQQLPKSGGGTNQFYFHAGAAVLQVSPSVIRTAVVPWSACPAAPQGRSNTDDGLSAPPPRPPHPAPTAVAPALCIGARSRARRRPAAKLFSAAHRSAPHHDGAAPAGRARRSTGMRLAAGPPPGTGAAARAEGSLGLNTKLGLGSKLGSGAPSRGSAAREVPPCGGVEGALRGGCSASVGKEAQQPIALTENKLDSKFVTP